MTKTRILIPVIALLLFIISTVFSLPRLAVEHNASCKTCHINPAGGGMRNEFGNYSVAFNELCFPQTKKYAAKRYRSPKLANGVSVGFDSRYLVFDNGRIFRMQTDVYLALEPWQDLFYQIRFGENGISEHYTILYMDDQRYFIKLGRFQPSHGLRIADHKSFIRDRTGNGSNIYLDGLALGSELAGINIATELFNPNEQSMIILHVSRQSYVNQFSYLLGGSFRFSEKITNKASPYPDTRSLYGGVSYHRFTLLSELDFTGKASDTLVFYAGLATRLQYGLYFITEYNFFDGNRDFTDGVDEYIRASLELFPLPFIELRPSYTYYTRGYRQKENDFFVQMHIGY